jgi:hypothetical protein
MAAEGEASAGSRVGTRRCEDVLCAAAINLLRGVTPPLGDACEEGAEGYGRYGHEAMEERKRRVIHRPKEALWCMACAEKYSTVGARCGGGGRQSGSATPDV